MQHLNRHKHNNNNFNLNNSLTLYLKMLEMGLGLKHSKMDPKKLILQLKRKAKKR